MDNTTISYQIYKPTLGRVLIEREVKKATSGIILPDSIAQRHAPCKGKIVALGETAGWIESYNDNGEQQTIRNLKIGDEVIFGRHSGAWIDATYDSGGKVKEEGKLFICQDADILCIIKQEQA